MVLTILEVIVQIVTRLSHHCAKFSYWIILKVDFMREKFSVMLVLEAFVVFARKRRKEKNLMKPRHVN